MNLKGLNSAGWRFVSHPGNALGLLNLCQHPAPWSPTVCTADTGNHKLVMAQSRLSMGNLKSVKKDTLLLLKTYEEKLWLGGTAKLLLHTEDPRFSPWYT